MEKERTPQLLIREAVADDTEAIRRMHAASWIATYPNDEHGVPYTWVKEYTDKWLTPEQIERSKMYVQKAIDDPSVFYRVGEYNGEVVGYVHAATNDDGSKELEAIYLHPDVIGKGVGRQLVEQAIEWVGEQQMTLEVAVYNKRAIKFYESNGFKIVPGTEYLYRDKIPVIQMIREAGQS